MPTTKTATVTLFEAYKTKERPGSTMQGTLIPNIMGGNHPRHTVEFTTVDELVDKGTALALEAKETSGHGYWVSFNMAERGARKPPGFDAKTRSIHVGLTLEPERV